MTTQHAQRIDVHALHAVADRMSMRGEHGSARMARFLARVTEMCAPVTDAEATEAIAAAVVRPDYDTLDPGIRDTVRLLNDAGFYTTDSGDGVSKPREWFDAGDALPYPHVVVASSPTGLLHDVQTLAALLGPMWEVSGTLQAPGPSAYVFVSRPLPVEI